MGVGSCGCLSSANVNLMVSPSFTFIKSATKSASAADDATHFKIVQRVKIAPLSVLGSSSLGNEPRKKFPDARLLGFFADRYNASECVFNTMPDA